MNLNVTSAALAALIASAVLSPSLSAKTVFSTKAHCFQMGDVVPDGWNGNLKIKLQHPLTDQKGAMVEAVANIHGYKSANPPMNYYNQLIGAAGYIRPGDQEIIDDSVQITLLGTSYGSDTTEVGEVAGTWFRNNILMLEKEKSGKALEGTLLGTKTFTPLATGVAQPSVKINKIVKEIPCSQF